MMHDGFFPSHLRPLIREARKQRDAEVRRMFAAAYKGFCASLALLRSNPGRSGGTRHILSH